MNNNKVFKIYGDNLKRFRTNNNLTQEQAAQITKLEAKYISQIERGVRAGTIATMLKFCTGYNVTPNDLFYNIIKTSNKKSNKKKDLESLIEKISRLNSRDKQLITDLVDGMLNNEK